MRGEVQSKSRILRDSYLKKKKRYCTLNFEPYSVRLFPLFSCVPCSQRLSTGVEFCKFFFSQNCVVPQEAVTSVVEMWI